MAEKTRSNNSASRRELPRFAIIGGSQGFRFLADGSRFERLQAMLENYSRRTGAMRLIARGLVPFA